MKNHHQSWQKFLQYPIIITTKGHYFQLFADMAEDDPNEDYPNEDDPNEGELHAVL